MICQSPGTDVYSSSISALKEEYWPTGPIACPRPRLSTMTRAGSGTGQVGFSRDHLRQGHINTELLQECLEGAGGSRAKHRS